MALYVNTNVTSLNSQRRLTNATNSLDTVYERLSSGLRINSAKDDAAGLQISDRMTAQINGLNQGNRNANDGIAMAQTAEGAMEEITTMLQRIRTLANQAATGTNTDADRKSIQDEVTQLSAEITRIACRTTYNGQTLLAGVTGAQANLPNTAADATSHNGGLPGTSSLLNDDGMLRFQVGSNAYDTIEISLGQGFSVYSLAQQANYDSVTGGTKITTNVFADVDDLKTAIGTDTAHTVSTSSGVVLDSEIGGARFSVCSQASAQATLASIDAMIQVVDDKRSELGALQNRMESTIRNQSNIAENTSDARSRIRDTDFAEESANLTQQSIIQQAASSMLMQANSRPQLALSLLG